MHERHPDRRAKLVLLMLLALALISMAAFMTLGAKGSWSFILPFRGIKLLSLLLVAYAIAVRRYCSRRSPTTAFSPLR